MSITTAQIRGARGILDWSQADLSERTGISATSIGSIENGQSTPRASTLETIRRAFENGGIEFIGLDGVRLKQDNIKVFEGQEGIRAFFDDVYEQTKATGKDICLFNGVPEKLIEWLGEEWYQKHAKRMGELETPFGCKIIVEQGETHFIANTFAEYRWFPSESFNQRTIYCYGNCIAFLNFKKNNVHIVSMDQADIVDSFRVLFDIAWDNVAAKPGESSVIMGRG